MDLSTVEGLLTFYAFVLHTFNRNDVGPRRWKRFGHDAQVAASGSKQFLTGHIVGALHHQIIYLQRLESMELRKFNMKALLRCSLS